MRKRRAAIAVLAVAALGSSLTALPAQAATTYEVQAGAGFFEQGVPGFSARFYPGGVTVHPGDTIHFSGFAPLLLPEGLSPQEFRERNDQPEDPFFLFTADPDDGPRAMKLNLNAFFPNADCGLEPENPCTWDGADPNEILNFGDEASELWVTVTADPGSVLYATSIFGSRTDFRVHVVDPGTPASTQQELDAKARRLLRQDRDDAAALHAKFNAKRTFHRDGQGRKVWDAWAGVDSGPIALLAMYPHKLRIRKGDRVQWHFPLESEAHNAYFPFDKAKRLSRNFFGFGCDPDGDQGTAPDGPPELEEPPFCNPPAEPEIDIDSKSLYEQGDGVFRGRDLEGSGLRGWETLSAGFFEESTWTLKFATRSPDKGFRYICTLHGPFMDGRVIVR